MLNNWLKKFWGGHFSTEIRLKFILANILQGASFRVTRFDTDSVGTPVHNSGRYRFLFGKYMISVFSMPLPYIIYFNKYYHFHFALKRLQLLLCTCFMHYLMWVIVLARSFVRRSKCPHVAKAARKIRDFAFLNQHVTAYPSEFFNIFKGFYMLLTIF